MKSRTRAKKRRGSTDPAKKTNSELNIDYFTFLKRNSTNESYGTKDRHQKVKITSCDLFEECIISIRQKIHGILQEPKISLFCGAIDGVDELLSAFSCFSPTRNNLYGIFFDINPHKVEYFTYRLHLTQISPTLVDYMRNLLFYMKGDQGLKPETILEKSKRNQVSSEIHATHLSQLAKNTVDPRPDGSLKELRHALKRGTDILSIVRDGKTHYKNLANGLIKNMRLNPTTHWLSNEENYQKIRQACAEGRIKAIQADLNRKGKEKILNILKNTGMRPLLLYIPKGTKKFRQTQELIELFDHCIDTIPPPGKTGRYRVWHEMDPERFFTTPQFKHQGELSNKQLLHLVDEYKGRTYVQSDHNDRCSLMLLGDMPFGRIYFDDRSNSFLNKIQDYVNRYNVKNVVLCGDMIDGEHTREKRKLALLQFLSDQPKTSIEEQCQMASSFISGFKGNVYSVTSDGDWDIIEEKQREILLQKEFQYKMDKNTMHIPDEVRKSLRVEAIFEAAKEYYDYLERNIPLSEKIGDSLAINFNTAKVRITHMSLGQYFRKSLTKAVGVKEQQIINQILANHDLQEEGGITIKVSSHDNVLQAHMESDNVLNVKVPSLESSTQYESIPIQIRNAVQDMMHKAFSVRGKIPFLSSCKVEVTEDARIMLTIINEKLLDMLEKYKDRPSEEYIIFNLCDAQIGSIAYRHDYLIKYMDYVKSSSQ
ncbi:hypothetical protein KY362_04920, partial [Candidatus Woesearchaeota archaeon]|nr:hypothetical protein [Candidatus Woesearchaeota archaeon]